MLECASCKTLNPNSEAACLSCGAPLAASQATGVSQAMGRCANGHPVDPSWTSCPYCQRQAGATSEGGAKATRLDDGVRTARKTRLESASPAVGSGSATRLTGEPPAQAEPPRASHPTRLEEPPPHRGRPTILHDARGPADSAAGGPEPAPPIAAPVEPARAAAGVASNRPMLAVLAAPELGPGGAVFSVRSGRNTLGSDRSNDIVLDTDTEVSREHAVILHRNGAFHLADRLSTNGTWINGEEVPANGTVPLEDRDRIRVGRTEMVFLRIDGSADASPD